MKANEIREQTVDDIRKRIADETEQLAHLQFQHAVAEIPNPLLIRQKRRLIGRLNTVLAEKVASE